MESIQQPYTAERIIVEIAGSQFTCSRPHRFGLVIHGVSDVVQSLSDDYLHEILLQKSNRDEFYSLIVEEGLVVCKNIRSESPSYRKVRGKSSYGKLSQAEYYHHDGCSSPVKPRFDEIRLPHQAIHREVATAVAPFPDVVRAQLECLPERFFVDENLVEMRAAFQDDSTRPSVEQWDQIQGRVTRLIRKEMDAEAGREYFRAVDRAAGAYDLPWEMGESRLMLNNHSELQRTMQHRRAYQKPKVANEQNGSLVKRWTAEEID